MTTIHQRQGVNKAAQVNWTESSELQFSSVQFSSVRYKQSSAVRQLACAYVLVLEFCTGIVVDCVQIAWWRLMIMICTIMQATRLLHCKMLILNFYARQHVVLSAY